MSKLKSRKFWMAVASVLGSIAAAIAGIASENEVITIIGIICGIVSAAIYEIVEAVVDCAQADDKQEIEELTNYEDGSWTVKYKTEDE